jgi:hypothetical protein
VVSFGLKEKNPMSSSRFEYSEICPTCKDAGVTGDDEKPITLGFDLDTHEISCGRGHVYDRLPSEAAGVAKEIDNSANGVAQKVDSLETKEVVFGSENEAVESPSEGSVGHRLEELSGKMDAANAEADSAALAQLSERLNPVSPEVVVSSVQAGDRPDFGLPRRVMLSRPETGNAQFLVAEGREVTLPSGDGLFGITVTERWLEAIKAEAEIQNQSSAKYLQDWFDQALENYWVSNYTQSR